MRRIWSILVVLGILGVVPVARAQEPPLPEPGFLSPSLSETACTPANDYEAAHWDDTVGPSQGLCRRLRFAYGPITVRPGQNDALIVPVTIEKPWYDGYVLRFKPDLVYANGTPPDVDIIHLHHAVWLNGREAFGGYDNIVPFFASGEEKTTALFPAGHGYPVNRLDAWMLLYMVHNYTTKTDAVWITYELDYVPKAAGDAAGIEPIHPIWLDVMRKPIAPGGPDTPANPVFNVQKGFGHVDPESGRHVCTWPRENCARFDPYGNATPQQGVPTPGVAGADEPVDSRYLGTSGVGSIVWMGGHLHPGGVSDDVELVRDGTAEPIFTSEAVAWNRGDPSWGDGPKDSWDFSMTTTGAHLGWKIRVERGDTLRLNATYDSETSWYENMGIVVAFIARGDGTGIDPFADATTTDTTNAPAGSVQVPGWRSPTCTADICTRGEPTHGHLEEAERFGGTNVQTLPDGDGPQIDTVTVSNFGYGLADRGVVQGTGNVPVVRAGSTVRFVNSDTGADVWHTITRCAYPCTGDSGLAYPKADGADALPATDDDYDSSEIGYGLFLSPAKVHADQELEDFAPNAWPPGNPAYADVADAMDDGVLWEFTPSEADVGQTVTFFCRIHIAMRGAVKVAAAP